MTLTEAKATLENALVPSPVELMKISEAALVLGVNDETLRRRIRQGKLRAWGARGTMRVRLSDLLPEYRSQKSP